MSESVTQQTHNGSLTERSTVLTDARHEALLRAHEDSRLIASRAYSILRQWFITYGLFDLDHEDAIPHRRALTLMAQTFSDLITGVQHTRVAIPLPPGCGKSQMLLASIAAVHELQSEDQLSTVYPVLVAQSKVSNLVEMIEDLTRMGNVPAEAIGLLHSKKFDPSYVAAVKNEDQRYVEKFAALPSSVDPQSKQFLFCTHQRLRPEIKAGKLPEVPEKTLYRRCVFGESDVLEVRPLAYDESLITATSWSISHDKLIADVAWLGRMLHHGLQRTKHHDAIRAARQDAYDFLAECLPILNEAVEEQKKNGASVKVVSNLPVRSDEELTRYKHALENIPTQPSTEAMYDFLEMCWRPVRVRLGNSDGDYSSHLTFTIGVPEGFDRILVTDASYPVRLLEQADDRIKVHPDPIFTSEGLQQIKSYASMTFHIIWSGGGRNGVESSLSRTVAEDRTYSQELVAIANMIPEDERILVVTYRTKQNRWKNIIDIVGTLRDDLRAADVDLDRFGFATWGSETATNKYRDFENVVLLGVVQRSEGDLLASACGAKRNLDLPENKTELNKYQISESAHYVFQAALRSRARKMIAPRTSKPVHVWVIFHQPNKLHRDLRKIMPDMVWKKWKPECIEDKEAKRLANRTALTQLAADYLDILPAEVVEVSKKRVKNSSPALKNLDKNTYQRLCHDVPAISYSGWTEAGHWFRRNNSLLADTLGI